MLIFSTPTSEKFQEKWTSKTTHTGTGYHDHNWGNADMAQFLHHWYWVREEEYYTAENLADMLQIERVTVRRYLELMEKEEKIYKIVEYGKVGRPQYKYRKV